MADELKALPSFFPITLLGVIASLILYETHYDPKQILLYTTSPIEFAIYIAGAIALSIEACKAASNSDGRVIADQLSSLLCGLFILLLYFLGFMQIYSKTSSFLLPKKYEEMLYYRPFLYSSIVVWLDVVNGFIIARYNRSR